MLKVTKDVLLDPQSEGLCNEACPSVTPELENRFKDLLIFCTVTDHKKSKEARILKKNPSHGLQGKKYFSS